LKTRLAACSLVLLCLALAAVPAVADNAYDNGPINGNTDAWTINFGYIVSNTFHVCCHGNAPGGNDITGISFGVWLFPGDIVTSVDVSITSDEFGGTTFFSGTVALTQTNISTNEFGYQIAEETGNFGPVSLADGSYWLNLQNAQTANGDPIYWDENSGPSSASESAIGTIPSEAFTLYGSASTTTTSTSTTGPTPEPSSIMLFGSGVLGLAAALRRKLMR